MSKRDQRNRTTLLEAFAFCVIIAGVAVVIYTTGRTVGVDIGRDEISAREHYETTKDRALAACVDTEPSALRKCVVEAAETAQNQSESRQDLYAQQDMSKWAFLMMVISGLTLFVTGLGIVWIRDTLVETRRAVKSADDSVRVTRDIGEAQVRAYLSAIKAEVVVDPESHKRFCVVKLKNAGNSPAIDVSFNIEASIFSTNCPEREYSSMGGRSGGFPDISSGEISSIYLPIGIDLEALQSPDIKHHLTFRGAISYRHVFSDQADGVEQFYFTFIANKPFNGQPQELQMVEMASPKAKADN